MLIKGTFEDSIKLKRIRKNELKYNFGMYFLIQQKLQLFGEKCGCQQNLKGMSHDLYMVLVFPR